MSQQKDNSPSPDQTPHDTPHAAPDDTPDREPVASGHEPVLVQEILTLLDPQPGQVMLDCTVGRGGHATSIIPKLIPGGRFIGLDVDQANIDFCQTRLGAPQDDAPVQVDLVRANFAQARAVLDQLNIDHAHLLLADLGFSSSQMDDPARGFSFRHQGPLDMRMDASLPQTAADLVNQLSHDELADLLYRFGDERYSRTIAAKIVEQRQNEPINTTDQLAHLVRRVYASKQGAKGRRNSPGRGRRINPATRTFMALRIAVNAELEALERLLKAVPKLIADQGRVALISFHSLEDRMVKRSFTSWQQQGQARKLTPKPLTAGDAERSRNPRARSAKLRAVQIIGR